MTTIEQPITDVWVDDKVPEKFTHLYRSYSDTAYCGAPRRLSVCAGHPAVTWKPGMMNCPIDGTPICTECLLLAG
jgi:hypothetical protein